jgi:transaldolase
MQMDIANNKLEQLKKMTTVVADTGELEEIKKYRPTDATTNPSLILAASIKPEYQFLLEKAISFSKHKSENKQKKISLTLDYLFVLFGIEILKIIPGRVSTEIDARLSFDTEGSINKAKQIISLYEKEGIDRKRILIKIASTWEGIRAAEALEKENIHCNMTLLFCLPQAIKCADAKATLISPFVGRILDWYKNSDKNKTYAPLQDPGVLCVTEIYNYYKKMDYATQIMGASFRNVEEILDLAGCDFLTIAPKFLEALQTSQGPIIRNLSPETAKASSTQKIDIDEKKFRLLLCMNSMATEKLHEGIRLFTKDIETLENTLSSRI